LVFGQYHDIEDDCVIDPVGECATCANERLAVPSETAHAAVLENLAQGFGFALAQWGPLEDPGQFAPVNVIEDFGQRNIHGHSYERTNLSSNQGRANSGRSDTRMAKCLEVLRRRRGSAF